MMLPFYNKHFNNILSLGTVPNICCNGIIIPIFKSGARNDSSNYHGICVSSCFNFKPKTYLDMPFRLTYFINLKSVSYQKIEQQIMFSPYGLLQTSACMIIVIKYTRVFVNFKTPFDSVWHGGFLHKLLQIGVFKFQ